MKVVPFDGELDAPAAEAKAPAVVPFDGALDPGPDTTVSDDAMRAGDPMGIVAQEQYKAPEVTGSVFDNQDQGGPRMDAPTNDAAVNERALDNARQANPAIDKSPMYSTGVAREKANSLVAKGQVAQDKAEAERTKSSGSTAQDVALNVLGGFGGTVNKAGATVSQAFGAEDAEAAFDSAAEMYKKMQADNGGGMLPGKVAGFVGSVAPAVAVGAVLPAAEAYVLLSNAGLFALPAFRDTLKEKLAAGQDFPLALAHASQSFGLNLFLPSVASKGGALLNTAAGKGIIGNAASAAAEGAGFSAATTVLDKGTDLVAGEKNEKNWLDLEDMGTMALGFGAMRGIHAGAGAAARGVSAGLDRVGTPSQQFGRAFGQDVDAAGFNRAQPANLNPNLRDVVPKAADPVAEIFKAGTVEEAAAAAARAADVPIGEPDTAAALRSARPMRPKPVEPTEGALDERGDAAVPGLAGDAPAGGGDLAQRGVDPDVRAGSPGTPAGVDTRGAEGEAEASAARVGLPAGDSAAVEARVEPFATKPEANMAALKEDAVAVPAEGGWTLQLKTRPYSDKEVAANEADIAAINDGLNHNNEARAEAGLPGDREPVRLLSSAPTAPMVVGRRIGRLLGVKVVFVEDHPGFSGVALRGVAYVSPQAKHPELAIIGHEVTHGILQRLRAEDPARAQALHEQLAAYVRQDAVDKKQAAEPDRSRKHAEEEVIADLNGSMWLDPKFWAEMRKADPSTFRKIAYAFMQAITKVTQNLSRFKAEDFTGDVDAVRKILAREMAQLAREEAVESHSPTEKQELGIKDAAHNTARKEGDDDGQAIRRDGGALRAEVRPDQVAQRSAPKADDGTRADRREDGGGDAQRPASGRPEVEGDAAFARKEVSPEVAALQRYYRQRTWRSEDEARADIKRRIAEDNERYPMFKPQDAAIADKLEFTRAAGGQVKIKMAADKPDTPHPLGGEKPDGDAPKVDWEAQDMQGDHDEASVMEKYGSGKGEVYRAWIDADRLPTPKGDDIRGGRMTEDSGPRSELSRRGAPPPIKVRVTARGKVEVLDGNHRLAYWLEQGHDSIPAYVIDERGAPKAEEPKFSRKPEAEKRKPGEVTREEARQMGDLRKKVKVLESLLECLG